jgi:predicted P-loop ATPase
VHELQHLVGEVSDDAILRLRQIISDRFGVDLGDQAVRDAVKSMALDHCYDPVLDMLAEAEANWDGKKRLDRMAVDYFSADDTPLNRAMVRKFMIAGVRRPRHPGVKFDNMLVLESIEGYNKSSALRVLAADYFSDESLFNRSGRDVIEELLGVWIHESGELSGLRRSDIEAVKALLSRQNDRGRPAYGHFSIDVPRRCIFTGTTNGEQYLLAQDGNRRFWPLAVKERIDLEKLKRDRLQLWGEAARAESAGESVVLDESPWSAAGEAQELRRAVDGWEILLADLGEPTFNGFTIVYDDRESNEERVATADILTKVLEIAPQRQTQTVTMRLANVMKRLGWRRPPNGKVWLSEEWGQVRGYFREKPKKESRNA